MHFQRKWIVTHLFSSAILSCVLKVWTSLRICSASGALRYLVKEKREPQNHVPSSIYLAPLNSTMESTGTDPRVPMKPAPKRGSRGDCFPPGYSTHKRPVDLFSGSSYLLNTDCIKLGHGWHLCCQVGLKHLLDANHRSRKSHRRSNYIINLRKQARMPSMQHDSDRPKPLGFAVHT